MIRNGLNKINLALGSLIIILLLMTCFYAIACMGDIETPDVASVRHPLPKRAFEQSKDSYSAIGQQFITLSFAPASMQLPDLRKKLVFYGKNGRPDATNSQVFMHFEFVGTKNPVSIEPGQKLYLCNDPSNKMCGYAFSSKNEPTKIWLQAEPDPKGAVVKLRMQGEDGKEIAFPEAHAQFVLPEKEYNRFAGAPWQLGKWRVDGSLFARQHARWYGKDIFLERHGGEEYQHVVGKERLDFGDAEEAYSIFVGQGDALVWEDEKWKVTKPGVDSFGKPLLLIKKVEDRIMNCELWDTEGKAKIYINLLRCVEPWIPQQVERSFKFVGAHTRSQFAFEVNKKRMILSPDDWLVFTPKGWKKLATPEDIDEYVHRKVTGPMFVFEGIGRKEDQQVLVGIMYNASRTEVKEVELPLAQQATMKKAVAIQEEEEADDEDDEDEEEDDENFPTPVGIPGVIEVE